MEKSRSIYPRGQLYKNQSHLTFYEMVKRIKNQLNLTHERKQKLSLSQFKFIRDFSHFDGWHWDQSNLTAQEGLSSGLDQKWCSHDFQDFWTPFLPGLYIYYTQSMACLVISNPHPTSSMWTSFLHKPLLHWHHTRLGKTLWAGSVRESNTGFISCIITVMNNPWWVRWPLFNSLKIH